MTFNFNFKIVKNEQNNILIKAIENHINSNIKNITFSNGEINNDFINGTDISDIKLLPLLIENEVEIFKDIILKKNINNNKEEYILSSNNKDAKIYVLEFIKKLKINYEKYLKKIENMKTIKYYYNLININTYDPMNSPKYTYIYDKYKLSNNKSFNNLFFKDKKNIIKLLDDFIEKKNKFKNEAMPNKLGFLLHGPPGTGKTSLIKAIANYSNRHIINISLNNIKKNKQLMDILFNIKITLKSNKEDDTISNYSQVIFVIEDIDCIGALAQRKDGESYELKNNNDSQMKQMLMRNVEKDKGDNLDLSGVLNILDGIIDTPERLLIITTNYKENMDEALFRPGRINRDIYMGYINYDNLNDMVKYYFGKKIKDDEVKKIFEKKNISPALIEQLCLECDTIKILINKLKNLQ